jgi:exosortase/archaeosortase family protein
MEYEHSLIIRLLLVLVPPAFFSLFLTPLTIAGAYVLSSIFYKTSWLGINLFVNGHTFVFVEACIATMAYYLVWLLIMLTKDISLKKRIYMVLTGFALIFLMNLLRIIILIVIFFNLDINYFESIHFFFWAFISGIYVALVWIVIVLVFKIKSIPAVDDIKFLYKKIKR